MIDILQQIPYRFEIYIDFTNIGQYIDYKIHFYMLMTENE